MNRPSGTESSNPIDAFFASIAGQDRRQAINRQVRGQAGVPQDQADRPSVHLSWGLQQMKLRGWRADDWGQLFTDDGSLGDGPVCILEAVGAPMDGPANLGLETPEQYYIRLAFVQLGQECPLYLSNWNDEQEDFAVVETIVNKAIELAAADEARDEQPYLQLSARERAERFGITQERLDYAAAEQKAADSQV